MFFFKRKPIVLDCFTSNRVVYEISPIDDAAKYVPRWWKELPSPDVNKLDPSPNMRHCTGFKFSFRNSFILPCWSDLNIEVGRIGTTEYQYQYADRRSTLHPHDSSQWGSFIDPLYTQHLKLISPWRCRCNSKINFVYSEPTWNLYNHPSKIRVLPGVMDHVWISDTNVNLVIDRSEVDTLHAIPLNTPLVHIIPLTEHRVVLKKHLVSEAEWESLGAKPPTFVNGHAKMKKACPFGFSKP